MSQTTDQRRTTPSSSSHRRDLWRPEEEDDDDPNTCDQLLEPTARSHIPQASTSAPAVSKERKSRRGTIHGIAAALLVVVGTLVAGVLLS